MRGVFVLYFLYFFVFSFFVFGHGEGGGEDKVVDGYLVDFGWNEEDLRKNEKISFVVSLADADTNESLAFTSVRAIVSDQENNVMFSTDLAQERVGRVVLTYAFPRDGVYDFRFRFQNGTRNVVEAEFDFVVGSFEQSDGSGIGGFFRRVIEFVAGIFKRGGFEKSVVNVVVNESGFWPEKVVVEPGVRVVWENRGERPHWPASDVHPFHRLYPNSSISKCGTSEEFLIFDACRGVMPGESYGFTFFEPGSWGVHDHLFPSLSMVVEVSGQKAAAGRLAASYTQAEKEVLQMSRDDPAAAWAYLKGRYVVNGRVVENVHEFAHVVGNELYRQRGLPGIAVCDDAFGFGCYHGVTEQMLLELGLDAVEQIEDECTRKFSSEQLGPRSSCIHGIGHGVLSWENFDVQAALVDCDVLEPANRIYCYDGVYMEFVLGSSGRLIGSEDPWSLCRDLEGAKQHACGRYQLILFEQNLGWNLSRSARECAGAPTAILKEACFSSLGVAAVLRSRGEVQGVVSECSLSPTEEGRSLCMTFAAVEFVFQEYALWETTAPALCGFVGKAWQERCWQQVNFTIATYQRRSDDSGKRLLADESQFSDEILEIKKTGDLSQRTKWYRQLIERVGPEAAQDELLRSGLPFDGETHLLNHEVGNYLYETEGAAGLIKCRDYFLASCYHGHVLNAIAVEGVQGVDAVMDACDEKGRHVSVQCAHAIGHGFLSWADYANLPDALKLCDETRERIPSFPHYNCLDGVFMENIWGVHEGLPSPDRWVNESDFVYPCNDGRIKPEYVNACWSNQPSLIYRYVDGDFGEVGMVCYGLEDEVHRETCFDAIARQIHPTIRGDVDSAFFYCEQMPSQKWIDECLMSIAVSDFSVGGRSAAFEICNRIRADSGERCQVRIVQVMGYYGIRREERNELCDLFANDAWKQSCKTAVQG